MHSAASHPSGRARAGRLALAAATLAAAGCWQRVPDAEAPARLAAGARVSSVRCALRLFLRDRESDNRIATKGHLASARGEEMRLRAQGRHLGTTIFDLAVYGDELALSVPPKKKFFHGSLREALARRALGFPPAAAHLSAVDLLFPGASALAAGEAALALDARSAVLTRPGEGDRPALRVRYKRPGLRPREMRLLSAAEPGRVLAVVTYEAWTEIGGLAVPTRLEARIGDRALVTATFSRITLDAKLPERLFDLAPPPGAERVNVATLRRSTSGKGSGP